MKHKKDYTALALTLAADTAAVANRLAEDGEEPLSDDEGRVFVARSLKRNRVRLIAEALRADEDEVRDALTALDAEKAAEAAEEVEPDAKAS